MGFFSSEQRKMSKNFFENCWVQRRIGVDYAEDFGSNRRNQKAQGSIRNNRAMIRLSRVASRTAKRAKILKLQQLT